MATAELPVIQRLEPEDFLETERKTEQYRPQVFGGLYGYFLDGRPWFNNREAERMRRDPQIQFGLRILRCPLYQVKIKCEAAQGRVGKFAIEQFRNIWDDALQRILDDHFCYGPATGEVSHRVSRGRVVFDRYDDVYPRDARPLLARKRAYQQGGKFVGIRVNNGSGGRFDLYAPHAFWFRGDAKYGSFWPRPRLADAYEPWLEKRGKHGAVDCRRLWFKKGAFSGGSIRYPLGFTKVELPGGTSTTVNNQDLAREIIEKFESGGTMCLPNSKDPKTQEFLWQFEPPKPGGEVKNILDYPRDLDEEILKGLGIPPEIVAAATVGSGYSGRAIPAQVFFTSCDEIVSMLLRAIDRQIIRPLVRLNFGDVDYKLRPESLAKQVYDADKDKGGGNNLFKGMDGGDGGWGIPSAPQANAPVASPLNLSYEAAESALRRIDREVIDLGQPFDERKHPRGKPKNAGQFASKPVAKGKVAAPVAKKEGGGTQAAGPDTAPTAEKYADQARKIVNGRLQPSKMRAWNGTLNPAGQPISKDLAGAVAEEVLIQYLKAQGFADAGKTSDHEAIKSNMNNLAFDLIHDHQLIEAKGGQTGKPSGVWALKYDGRFTKEQEAKFSRMSPDKVKEAKRRINQAKVKAIHDRKQAFIDRLSKELEFTVKPGMMTCIINPETKTADIYKFDGLYDRIAWNSEMAKNAYVTSVKFG